MKHLLANQAFLYLEDIQSKFNTIKNNVKVKSDDQVVGKITQLEEKNLLKQQNKEITSLKMGNIEDQVETINEC